MRRDFELETGEVRLALPSAHLKGNLEVPSPVQETVCVSTPESFLAVGRFYEDFDQTSDSEVVELLGQARAGFASDAVGMVR